MRRVFARRVISLLAVLYLSGCGKGRDAERSVAVGGLASALARADDAVSASQLIASAQIGSCAALGSAVSALQKQPWEAAVLRGLIEELLQVGQGLCSEEALQRWPPGVATSLAQSLLATDSSAALEVLNRAPRAAVILRRRAELLFASGDDAKAREALIDSLTLEEHEEVRGRVARLTRLAGDAERALALCAEGKGLAIALETVAALAALGRNNEVVAMLASAEVHELPELASAAVGASADVGALGKTERAGATLLFALSVADGVSQSESAAYLRRATVSAPERAELWSALADVEEREGAVVAAVVAWDRTAALASGASRPVLAPIRLLLASGNSGEALKRARLVETRARDENTSDSLHLASQAFRYAKRPQDAVRLAREALAIRPGEGRLQSELAHRLVEAGALTEATRVLAALLACGSRGRPWHRHEVVVRLAKLVGEDGGAAAVAEVGCQVVDAEGLGAALR